MGLEGEVGGGREIVKQEDVLHSLSSECSFEISAQRIENPMK